MTELHGSSLKVALTHFSAIFLCTLLLPDFSFTVEENLLEIIMRRILCLFLKKSVKKSLFSLEIVCLLCLFFIKVFFAGTSFANKKNKA